MRKTISVLVALGLVASAFAAVPADAKSKKKKTPKPYTINGTYDQPAIGTAGAGVTLGGMTFTSSDTNTFMTVEVTDGVSPIPYGDFSWDTDGDGVSDTGVVVCGTEAKNLEVPPNTTITAFMWALPSPFCAGFSTSGTAKVTFSATPLP
jgi:hypothetical protein